ncbi:hypothetical protein DLM78_13710 [Leptospira stimsonii]|uniref:Uncharacterized protein n=1 Tax=Leptospira stimsonii TaxID=2202203 RepID=A0A8B3CQ88_9LEPT|nr:hypothetical protein DLM78_13710 [Leptospira stimsonii]
METPTNLLSKKEFFYERKLIARKRSFIVRNPFRFPAKRKIQNDAQTLLKITRRKNKKSKIENILII